MLQVKATLEPRNSKKEKVELILPPCFPIGSVKEVIAEPVSWLTGKPILHSVC